MKTPFKSIVVNNIHDLFFKVNDVSVVNLIFLTTETSFTFTIGLFKIYSKKKFLCLHLLKRKVNEGGVSFELMKYRR